MKNEFTDNLYDECFILDEKWENLKNLAMPEDWDYKSTPCQSNYPILRSYICFTFKRLVQLQNLYPEENYMVTKGQRVCVNTGLLTPKYEQIYMIMEKNRRDCDKKYFCKGFYKESDGCVLSFGQKPKRAKYFNSLNDLFLNPDLEIVPNVDHIMEDEENKKRIPEDLRNLPSLLNIFKGEIETLKKRLQSNYKLAVPQYFNGKIQLLLPISLRGRKEPDLVLAVERIKNFYRGSTCLTLDMAYNNARVIAKPETDWLVR